MPSPRRYRILVVDDLTDNLFLLQTVLEAEGYEVDTADSGRLALEKVNSSPPDLILLDVMMPEMTGFDVMRHLGQNEALCSIPILLLTAHSHANISQAIELGANDFIRKPVDLDRLLDKIRALCP